MLKTKCDNTFNGCEWTGELRSLEKHLLSCDFTLLPCPNQCKKDGEIHIVKLLRKDIEKHKKEECPRRQYECPHCKETGEYQERTTTHLKECPKVKIPCPREGCSERIKRCNIKRHRQKCLYERIPCKHSNIGCEEMVPRKHLEEHEGDCQLHFPLAIDAIQQLKGVVGELKSEINNLKLVISQRDTRWIQQQSKVASLESSVLASRALQRATRFKFRVTNFVSRKKNNYVEENVFYTFPGGYKMCIFVHTNGKGEGEGTHISVYAYLMRGEYDDHLFWPFTGTVTVELLNQLKDKNHYASVFDYGACTIFSTRVMDGELASCGNGEQCYIPHSSLGYDEAKRRQYLKDDCLYFNFSIQVDTKATSKLWLV